MKSRKLLLSSALSASAMLWAPYAGAASSSDSQPRKLSPEAKSSAMRIGDLFSDIRKPGQTAISVRLKSIPRKAWGEHGDDPWVLFDPPSTLPPSVPPNPTQEALSRAYKRAGMRKPADEWYVGSLFSPSPALAKAGQWEIEPYFGGIVPNGEFTSDGHYHGESKRNPHANGFYQHTLIEYAFTDHITLAIHPNYTYLKGNGTHHSSGLQVQDFPFDFKYRLGKRYTPSLTFYVGALAPVGKYDNLSNKLEGAGGSAWKARFGMIWQYAMPFFSRQQRFRVWAQGEQPFSSTHIKNLSIYGTDPGFSGTGHPSSDGNEGIAWEGGITKRFILALDLYHEWTDSMFYSGRYISGGARTINGMTVPQGQHFRSSRTSWSGGFHVSPAVEWGFTPNLGVVAGVDITAVSHNESAALQPQAAICWIFGP